jgi:hypothetical protein
MTDNRRHIRTIIYIVVGFMVMLGVIHYTTRATTDWKQNGQDYSSAYISQFSSLPVDASMFCIDSVYASKLNGIPTNAPDPDNNPNAPQGEPPFNQAQAAWVTGCEEGAQ